MQLKLYDNSLVDITQAHVGVEFIQGQHRAVLTLTMPTNGITFEQVEAMFAGSAKTKQLAVIADAETRLYENHCLRTRLMRVEADEASGTQEHYVCSLAQLSFIEVHLLGRGA